MRVLAYVSPARGHLYPIVPTLLELQQRGTRSRFERSRPRLMA